MIATFPNADQRIAEEAQMDVALVERCLQCLRQCGVIALVEAIQVGQERPA
jgi:muramoyltetrapeptide carboxypeptidase LdcA involved in peptidoglycan recycling